MTVTASVEQDGTGRDECARRYKAFFDGCRNAELAALPPEQQLWELTRLISEYAVSAREARVPSQDVLAELRSALAPVAQARRVSVAALMHRASADYYAVRWS